MLWMVKFFLVCQSTMATAPELLQAFPKQVLRNEIVEFKAVAEHHLSAEAPQKCGSGQLIERTARFVKCQFTVSGVTNAVLNVCDDKKTFCKPIEVSLAVADQPSSTPEKLVKNQTLNQDLKKELVPGFVEGAPDELRKLALGKGLPVLVMVSTDWCPPCNEAKENLFKTNGFQKLTANWLKIYVDGDKLAAAEWGQVVPFRYFPSFVLLNSKFEEVSRFYGELRVADFEKWSNASLAKLNDPIFKVQARVEGRRDGTFLQKVKDKWSGVSDEQLHKDRVRLLEWAMDMEKEDLVTRLLKQGQYPEIGVKVAQHRLAEIDKLEDSASNLKNKIELQSQIVDLTLEKEDWSEHLAALCAIDEIACKSRLEQIPRRMQFLKTRPSLSDAERAFMLAEESYYFTEVFGVLKDVSNEKKWAGECVKSMESLPASAQKMRSVGQMLIPCFEKAGEFAKAEKVLKPLIQSYSKEPTFLLRMARLKRKQKKLDESLVWLDRAEALAYGSNWFSLQLIKTEVLLELKRNQDASRVIDSTLQQVRLEGGESTRHQGLVARLRAAQVKADKIAK